LYRLNAQKALAAGEQPSKELQQATLLEWNSLQDRKKYLGGKLKLGGAEPAIQGGSDYFQTQMKNLPLILSRVLDGTMKPNEVYALIDNNKQLQGPEKWALRQAAREQLGTFGSSLVPEYGPAEEEGGWRGPTPAQQAAADRAASMQGHAPRRVPTQFNIGGGNSTPSPLMSAVRPGR
jgi:hypothetical protein